MPKMCAIPQFIGLFTIKSYTNIVKHLARATHNVSTVTDKKFE